MDIVRGEYGYTDEYILDKTLLWLTTTVEYISRRQYEYQAKQASMIAFEVSNLFADKDKRQSLPTYDELKKKAKDPSAKMIGNHDESFDSGSLDFLHSPPKKK